MGLLLCFHHFAVHSSLISFYLNLFRSQLEHHDCRINIQLQCLWMQPESVLLWKLIDLIRRDKVQTRLNWCWLTDYVSGFTFFAAPPSFTAFCEFVLNSNPINLCHLNTAFHEKTFSSLVREIFFNKFPWICIW